MSQYPINYSFSFDKRYMASHEFSGEYMPDPTIPQNNSIGFQNNIPQVNPPNDQLNPFSQQGNIIKAQIISFDSQINSPVNNLASKDNSSGENNNLFAQKLKPSDDQVAHLFPHDNSVEKNARSFNNEPININFYAPLKEYKAPVKVPQSPGIDPFHLNINLKEPYTHTNTQVQGNISSSFNYKEPHNKIKAKKNGSDNLSNSFPQDKNSINLNIDNDTKKYNLDAPAKEQNKKIDQNKDITSLLENIVNKYHQSYLKNNGQILNNNQNNIQIINQGLNNRQNNEQVNQIGQNQDNSQIFDDSVQRLKQILLNKLLEMYAPQRQNQNIQPNQKKADRKNSSDKNSNNINLENLSGLSSINDESNSKIKELIKINKLLSLVIFISNESNAIQRSTLSELIKSNQVQQSILLELINANNEQKNYNKILEKSIVDTLSYLKSNISNNQNNSNISSPFTYYNLP